MEDTQVSLFSSASKQEGLTVVYNDIKQLREVYNSVKFISYKVLHSSLNPSETSSSTPPSRELSK